MARRTIFCAFDAGGGNAVLPVARAVASGDEFEVLCLVGGPSREIFAREGIKFTDADLFDEPSVKKLVEDFKPDIFFSGTSAGPTFDKKILPTVKKMGARSFYILDFWSRYRERFDDLPDYILVMDDMAREDMIAEGFDSRMIVVTGNPYFAEFQKKIRRGVGDGNNVLFISQYEDRVAVLDDLIDVLRSSPHKWSLVIRPHPKEDRTKFDKYTGVGERISLDTKSLIEDLVSGAGLLVGVDSMVLFQAALAGKPVISHQPRQADVENEDERDPLAIRAHFKCQPDLLPSNKLGLSKLVIDKSALATLVNEYFEGKFVLQKVDFESIIIDDALRNVLNVIKKQ